MAEEITTKIPAIRVFYDRIITTVNYQLKTEGGVLLGDGKKGIPYTKQTVLVAGPTSNVSVGDEVEINFNLFPTHKTAPKLGIGGDTESIILPLEYIDEEDYFFISSREVKWVYGNPTSTPIKKKAKVIKF